MLGYMVQSNRPKFKLILFNLLLQLQGIFEMKLPKSLLSYFHKSLDVIVPPSLSCLRHYSMQNKSSTETNKTTSSSTSAKRKSKSQPKTMTETTKKSKSTTNYTYFAGRRWTSNGHHSAASTHADNQSFTLMSYNVLSQNLLDEHSYLYSDHIHAHLNWKHRFKLLMDEIEFIAPEILCLQEVQTSHLEMFVEALQTFSLDQHIYKKRTDPSRTDGCAIFYNSKRFEVMCHETLEYYQPNVPLLDKPNVAVLAKFSVKQAADRQCFVVATTHLLYNPRRQDIRLAQCQLLLAEIDRLSANGRSRNGKLDYVPTILTGDFNLEPFTAPYRLLCDGKIQYEHRSVKSLETHDEDASMSVGKWLLPPHLDITDHCQHLTLESKLYHSDRAAINNGNDDDQDSATNVIGKNGRAGYPFGTGTLRHKLNLRSVYNVKESISTFQNRWLLVDYIFYTKLYNSAKNYYEEGPLKLIGRYELPTVAHSQDQHRIPNDKLGSDHFSLAAKFALIPNYQCS